MNGYKQMYLKLFNKISDIIVELQEVQKEVEEIYVSKADEPVTRNIEFHKHTDKD